MSLRTRLCDLLGIEHPILNAPMGGGDAPAELAAAVSGAGGLGLIGGTTQGGAEWVTEQVRRARDLTDRPFGVGFICHFPGADALVQTALDEGVRIIALSFADPTPFVGPAHDAGAIVLCQVRTVAAARQAAAAGVDVIAAQGTEAGGHTGHVSTLPLVPAVIDAVAPLPVVAAGGIADGRGVAAALMLGADGVWIGTRFVVTAESGVADEVRARIVGATADDTVLTDVFDLALGYPWPDDVSGRALANRFSREWEGREAELAGWSDDQREQHAASLAGDERDTETRAVWAGEVASLVGGVESAADVVTRLSREASELLASRPVQLLGD